MRDSPADTAILLRAALETKEAEGDAASKNHLVKREISSETPPFALPQESESITVPEESGRDWCVALAIFVLSLLYLRLFYDSAILNADEGIILQGAQRIRQGQVLTGLLLFFSPRAHITGPPCSSGCSAARFWWVGPC